MQQTEKYRGYKPYMIAAIAVAIIGIVLFGIINITSITSFIGTVWAVIAPVAYGFCIAYLCNPIMNVFDRHLFKKIKLPGLRRALSLVMTTLVVLAGLALFLGILVPEIYQSATNLINNLDSYIDQIIALANSYIGQAFRLLGFTPEMLESMQIEGDLIKVDAIKDFFTKEFATIYDSKDPFNSIKNFLDAETLDKNSPLIKKLFHQWFPPVGSIITSAYTFIITAFFSILIAYHLLATKETRLAQVKKMRKALFTKEQNKFIGKVLKTINDSFGSYLEGKLLDALIIFALCLLSFWIFGVSEYFVLISVLIGITDIIPVVGPFIGAIPGGFIILITNPSKFLLYVILVVLIQQIEGNIISPKILGQNMGVSALCVLVSIVTMGTIFAGNPIALIVSVPLFAVVVELWKMFIEHRLEQKGLPTDTAEYYRGQATEDEIDFAVHYQNRKLAYYFEHSKLKIWMDKKKEQRKTAKEELHKDKISAESTSTPIDAETEIDQTQDNQIEQTEQTEQVQNDAQAKPAENKEQAAQSNKKSQKKKRK